MSSELRYKTLYNNWKTIQSKREEVNKLVIDIKKKQKQLKLLQKEIPNLLDRFNEVV